MFTWFNKEGKTEKMVTAKKVQLNTFREVVQALEAKKEDLTKIIDKLNSIVAIDDQIQKLDDQIKKQFNISVNYDFKSEKRLLDAFDAFDVKKLNEAVSDTVAPEQKKKLDKAEDKDEAKSEEKGEAKEDKDLTSLFEETTTENKDDEKVEDKVEEKSLAAKLLDKSLKRTAENTTTENKDSVNVSDSALRDPVKKEQVEQIINSDKSPEAIKTELESKGLSKESSLYDQFVGMFRTAGNEDQKDEEVEKLISNAEDNVEELNFDELLDNIKNTLLGEEDNTKIEEKTIEE